MPCSGPSSAASRNAALISSTLVARSASTVRSTSEPVGVGDADREAGQATFEFGDHEPERLRRAGRGRNQVERGRAGAAQVLVRPVEQVLVGGVGVDRGHQAVADPDRLVQDLRDRGEAVGRARRVADDVIALGVVDLVEVDADDDGRVERLGRPCRARRRSPCARPPPDARRRPRACGSGRWTRSRRRPPARAHGSFAGDGSASARTGWPSIDQLAAVDLDGRRGTSRRRSRSGAGARASRRPLMSLIATISIGGILRVGGAQNAASDAAEAVDCNSGGHLWSSAFCGSRCVLVLGRTLMLTQARRAAGRVMRANYGVRSVRTAVAVTAAERLTCAAVFQVRIHGRGGQGVVTAAELLSVAAFNEGRHAQAFPSFGSERTGAPVVSFCRIDDRAIRAARAGHGARRADRPGPDAAPPGGRVRRPASATASS